MNTADARAEARNKIALERAAAAAKGGKPAFDPIEQRASIERAGAFERLGSHLTLSGVFPIHVWRCSPRPGETLFDHRSGEAEKLQALLQQLRARNQGARTVRLLCGKMMLEEVRQLPGFFPEPGDANKTAAWEERARVGRIRLTRTGEEVGVCAAAEMSLDAFLLLPTTLAEAMSTLAQKKDPEGVCGRVIS